MSGSRTVHDPFVGADGQISDRLTDRLRGKYACGPHLPNGNPEFGWRQFQAPPIQHEAAARIEELERDAARYRYLRDRDLDTIDKGGVFAGRTPQNVVLNGDDLDAAIDAAMAGD